MSTLRKTSGAAALLVLLSAGSGAALAQVPVVDAGVPLGATQSYAVPASVQPTPQPVASARSVPNQAQQPAQGELYYQLQLLQQEVMELRGIVEEQSHQISQLKQQSLERYVELDKRLTGSLQTPPAESTSATNAAPASTEGVELPGESDAYRAAYQLVKTQQFDRAVAAFKQFLQDYPEGKFRANAYYWLGELYLVVQPQDLESSRQSFVRLVDQYPQHSKVPDALYKLGKVQFMKGDRPAAKAYLERVINEYGQSASSAPKLAKEFLQQNF